MSNFIPGGDLSWASIATCPTCERTGLLDPGAPGPQGWLDLQVWDGRSATGVGWFCSVECLDEAMPSIIENYSAEISRTRFDE